MRRIRARWYLHYSTIMGGNGEKPIERGFPCRKGGLTTFNARLSQRDSILLGAMQEIVSDHGTWKSRGDSTRFPRALSSKFPFVPYGRISLSLSGRVSVWSGDCNFYRDVSGPASISFHTWLSTWLKWCYENEMRYKIHDRQRAVYLPFKNLKFLKCRNAGLFVKFHG